MEPVYNRTIFNSTFKVQLYGFFSFLNSGGTPKPECGWQGSRHQTNFNKTDARAVKKEVYLTSALCLSVPKGLINLKIGSLFLACGRKNGSKTPHSNGPLLGPQNPERMQKSQKMKRNVAGAVRRGGNVVYLACKCLPDEAAGPRHVVWAAAAASAATAGGRGGHDKK